jgi:hypothetical protein
MFAMVPSACRAAVGKKCAQMLGHSAARDRIPREIARMISRKRNTFDAGDLIGRFAKMADTL